MRHEVFIQFITYTETKEDALMVAEEVSSQIFQNPEVDNLSCSVESLEDEEN